MSYILVSTSPSAEHSTFSKTAIVRGRCDYINFRHGKNCNVKKTLHGAEKEVLLKTRVNNEDYFKVPNVDSDVVFDSIKFYHGSTSSQCLKEDTPKKVIADYWSARDNEAGVHTAYSPQYSLLDKVKAYSELRD
jgi:hypothetical protein